MKKILSLVLALAVLMGLMTAFTTASAESDTIKIGTIYAMSGGKAAIGENILRGDQAGDAVRGDVRGHLVRQLRRLRAHTGTVDKGERAVKAHALHQGQRILEFRFRLAGKADDQVGGQPDIGPRLAESLRPLHVLGHGVVPDNAAGSSAFIHTILI